MSVDCSSAGKVVGWGGALASRPRRVVGRLAGERSRSDSAGRMLSRETRSVGLAGDGVAGQVELLAEGRQHGLPAVGDLPGQQLAGQFDALASGQFVDALTDGLLQRGVQRLVNGLGKQRHRRGQTLGRGGRLLQASNQRRVFLDQRIGAIGIAPPREPLEALEAVNDLQPQARPGIAHFRKQFAGQLHPAVGDALDCLADVLQVRGCLLKPPAEFISGFDELAVASLGRDGREGIVSLGQFRQGPLLAPQPAGGAVQRIVASEALNVHGFGEADLLGGGHLRIGHVHRGRLVEQDGQLLALGMAGLEEQHGLGEHDRGQQDGRPARHRQGQPGPPADGAALQAIQAPDAFDGHGGAQRDRPDRPIGRQQHPPVGQLGHSQQGQEPHQHLDGRHQPAAVSTDNGQDAFGEPTVVAGRPGGQARHGQQGYPGRRHGRGQQVMHVGSEGHDEAPAGVSAWVSRPTICRARWR